MIHAKNAKIIRQNNFKLRVIYKKYVCTPHFYHFLIKRHSKGLVQYINLIVFTISCFVCSHLNTTKFNGLIKIVIEINIKVRYKIG